MRHWQTDEGAGNRCDHDNCGNRFVVGKQHKSLRRSLNYRLRSFFMDRPRLAVIVSLIALACQISQVDAADHVAITPDVVFGHKHGMALTMDVYRPEKANGVGVLFMVSGGWYSIWAPPEQTRGLFNPLLDNGYTVFAVRHGSSPKFLIPEIVEDVRRSVRFVRSQATEYGVDPDRLGVSGGSAGGHLSLMLATTGDDGDETNDDPILRVSSRVSAAVAYFPPTDVRPYVEESSPYRTNYPALQFEKEKAADMSPLVQASADDAPSLMIHGDKDELVPIWHSEKMIAAFNEANVDTKLVVIQGAAHGFDGKDKENAESEWVAWFDKYLLKAKHKSSSAVVKSDSALRDGEAFELLWPEGAPEAKGDETIDKPAISVHLPDPDKATGAAVIVNPGGGYHVLAADHEGLQVARELNRQGIAAFVLRYRVRPTYEPAQALLDAKRAVRYVRNHADRFGFDPDRLGMLGFSAGGHLSSWVGTDFDVGQSDTDDPIERQSCRPDFLCLVYPAISGKLFERDSEWTSTDELVTKDTPPTFLVHTHEDGLSPKHSVQFYTQLLDKGVPAELHVFGHGQHGLGLAPGDPDMGSWSKLFVNWMRRRGLLADAEEQPLTGKVFVNDKPLFWGWVTFVPQNPNQPTRAVYVHQSKDGTFELSEKRGIQPGRYNVEVRVVAEHFDKPNEGVYSIDDAQLLTQGNDGETNTVEIEKGSDKSVEIRVSSD
jgi:acetyl esterase/lipase